MGYDVVVREGAEDWLDNRGDEIKRRFFKKVERLRDFPDKYGKPLSGPLSGFRELYFENKFRIVYEVDKSGKQVDIWAIVHKDEQKSGELERILGNVRRRLGKD